MIAEIVVAIVIVIAMITVMGVAMEYIFCLTLFVRSPIPEPASLGSNPAA